MTPGETQKPAEPREARLQRTLKIIIGAMSLFIIAGLAAVAFRLVQVASGPPGAAHAGQTLSLPQGAAVRAVTFSGSRIAVHYTSPSVEAVAVHDVETGKLVTRLRIDAGGAPE